MALFDKKRPGARSGRRSAPGDVSGFVRGDRFILVADENVELVYGRAIRSAIHFHAVYFNKTRVIWKLIFLSFPARLGIQKIFKKHWIPAFAGMTERSLKMYLVI